MVSRTTRWRRNEELKKKFMRMIEKTNSSSNEKYMFI